MRQVKDFNYTMEKDMIKIETRCKICHKKLMVVKKPKDLLAPRTILWSRSKFFFIMESSLRITKELDILPVNIIQLAPRETPWRSMYSSENCFCTEEHAKAFLFNYLLKK